MTFQVDENKLSVSKLMKEIFNSKEIFLRLINCSFCWLVIIPTKIFYENIDRSLSFTVVIVHYIISINRFLQDNHHISLLRAFFGFYRVLR